MTAAPATELELWRLDHFSQADLNDPSKESTIWGDLADPEKDGLGNLLEYALNGDPNQPDAASLLPQLSRSGDQLTLTYTMYRSNLVYRVRTNTLLDDPGWTGDGVIQTPDPDTALPGTEISAATTLEGNRRFLSLEVTVP